MKYFIRFMILFVILLAIFVVFEDDIVFFVTETYYSFLEDKNQNVQISGYEEVFENQKYWDGRTFLLDVYAKDLGYVNAVKKLEPELENGERIAMWRCGPRRFSIGSKGETMIGIIGDDWEDDLSTETTCVQNGFNVSSSKVFIENVDEETMVYFISEILRLRQNDTLLETTNIIRQDIERYHIKNAP